MTATLSSQQIQAYKDQGYLLHHQPLFAPDKLERLTAIFEEHLAEKGAKLSDELDTPHFRDERLLDYLLSKEALDLVEGLIGPDIVLWSSHFICKDPFKGRMTPWHEDSAYWNGRFDRYDSIVTIWLALDRSTRDNGCMRVIPGTHTNGFSEYEDVDKKDNTFHARIKNIDESKAVYFELEPGECSLHDSRIVHGAAANTSPNRRCGYTMRYISAATKVNPDKNQGWRFWLARGDNIAGNPCERI